MKSWIISLPFVWIISTLIYLLLQGLGLNYIASGLGFIVPIGIHNAVMSLEGGVWYITFPLVVMVVVGGECLIKRFFLRPSLKIIAIFMILFLLTIAVDYIIYGEWMSLAFFHERGSFSL